MLHRFILPPGDWGTFESLSFDRWDQAKWEREKDLLFPFLLTASLVKSAWRAFHEENLSKFDPIVRENSCHIRAGALLQIFRDPRLIHQLRSLALQAEKVEKRIRDCLGKPKKILNSPGGLHLGDVVLSEREDIPSPLLFLVQAHFLTLGKVFSINTQGKEVSQLLLSLVRSLLKLPQKMSEDLIDRMILCSQSSLSRITIEFIQKEATLLFDEAEALPRRMLRAVKVVDVASQTGHPQSLRSSCALFNFHVVLQRLKRDQRLVLVKENKAALGKVERRCERVFFRSVDGQREFSHIVAEEVDRTEGVFVFEGFLPGGVDGLLTQIERVGGLSEAVLINVAHLPQFGIEGLDHLVHDEEAEAQIARRRLQAQELGCFLKTEGDAKRRFFTISHTFAAVAGEVEMQENI